MIVLNTFQKKYYPLKGNKNGSQRCFEIIYKKGKKNVVADALSRKDEDVEALLCAISIIQPNWINEAREEWKNDEEVWALIRKLQQDSSTSDTFSQKNDFLWYKIAYTSVRIPNSNKRFLWNCTLLPQEGTQDFQKLTTGLRRNFLLKISTRNTKNDIAIDNIS